MHLPVADETIELIVIQMRVKLTVCCTENSSSVICAAGENIFP